MPRNPLDTRGESGALNATVFFTVGGTYVGFGLAGYTGGTTYVFNARVRESDFSRGVTDMSNFAFGAAIAGKASRHIHMTVFYRGNAYPPDFEQYEFAYFKIVFGSTKEIRGVLLLDSFRMTGDVERAVEYDVSGVTDGYFS